MSKLALPEPDRTIITHLSVILKDLQRMIGAANVIGEHCGRAVFETDAFAQCRRTPLVVVMPTSTDDVVQVLRYAKANRIKVVARGAGTSTTGAAIPAHDALVVCLSRMSNIVDIDYHNRTITVEAGITTDAITRAIAQRGFFYAPDPNSAVACTLAGNIATDAGGSRGLKYGTTANHVLGLTLVTMDGEILQIGGDHLDLPGFDMLGLIAGSEGQMGIITQATLRILRKPEVCRPVLLAFASVQAAGQCVAAILKAGFIPTAIEFMDKAAIEACEAYTNAGYPTNAQALIIVEVEGSTGEISSLQSKIVETSKLYGPNVVRVGQNEEQSAAIWKGRRSVFGAIAASNETRWLDGAIPLGRLAEVLQSISEICARRDLRALNIFHAGDGTLHPIIFKTKSDGQIGAGAAGAIGSGGANAAPDKAVRNRAVRNKAAPDKAGRGHGTAPDNSAAHEDDLDAAAEEILRLCVDVGGSLSGENGIGLEKRDLMSVQFSADDLAIQMRLKSSFDPDWLLNSAKMFPLAGRIPAARSS